MVDLASTEVMELGGPWDLPRSDLSLSFGLLTAKLIVLFLLLLNDNRLFFFPSAAVPRLVPHPLLRQLLR